MTQHEYVFIAISVILGLALTRLLNSVAGLIRAHKRVIDVPVSYFPRLGGESKHSSGYVHIARTALKMLKIIFEKRLGLG